jgi:hypothetical protein
MEKNQNKLSDEDFDIDFHYDLDFDELREDETWSSFLEEEFGDLSAASFAIGSDLLMDAIKDDMKQLSSMPPKSNLEQLEFSSLSYMLPEQFMKEYDCDFLSELLKTLQYFREEAHKGNEIITRSVIEELTLFLVVEESRVMIDDYIDSPAYNDEYEDDFPYTEWIYEIFDDMDIITWLYSDMKVDKNNIYHFDHWLEKRG